MTRTRIHVPLTDDARASLQQLADVRRSSLAAICSEMLEQVAPVAVQMANALRMAQDAPAKALLMMSDTLEAQMLQADQYRLDIDDKVSPKATRRKYTKKTG